MAESLGRVATWEKVAEVAVDNAVKAIRLESRPQILPASTERPIAPPKAADKTRDRIARLLGKAFECQDGIIKESQLKRVLATLAPTWSTEDHDTFLRCVAVQSNGTGITCTQFIDLIFEEPPVPPTALAKGWGQTIDDVYREKVSLSDKLVQASFLQQLLKLVDDHPYLEPGKSVKPHPLHYWVERCRESFDACHFGEAQVYLHRLIAGLEMDRRQITEAFKRFDVDGSGYLDEAECRHMSAYLGWGAEEASLMDLDKDGFVTLPEYQAFVGRLGGVAELFAHRRNRISASRRDVCDHHGISVGARVRSHFFVHKQKSRSWKEAVVLEVNVLQPRPVSGIGPPRLGVLLEFGFGRSEKRRWRARQVVPPEWILSGVEDASIVSALREIGLLDDHQAFWAMLLPESELQAVEKLEDCQRKALACVRAQSTVSHEQALPEVRERFKRLGYTGREVEAVLSWIQDLAPACIHVHLDRMGQFMEIDEFYRNQFETKTSCGALDPGNVTRTRWETELFGGHYDDAKGFDRCKYGALNVMNDYRGVVKAKGYGDSYLVLKDVRLRLTFASTDSGGLAGKRLAVLDKYAHVLSEYNDTELQALITVAMAATTPSIEPAVKPILLRGSTQDPTMDWVTIGFPNLAQESGRLFYEVILQKGCNTPQVGLLSTAFEVAPGVKSTQGVGDDVHGWAVDGQNAARWHRGDNMAWDTIWKSTGNPRVLSQDVVVGVAVDFDKRQIWFATDGVWNEMAEFAEDVIPFGVALYPAISLKGRATFNFGPTFRHGKPSHQATLGTVCFSDNWNDVLEDTIKIVSEQAPRERFAVFDCNERDLGLIWNDHGKSELRVIPETEQFPLQLQARHTTCAQWAVSGSISVDSPKLGNEEHCRIYKEIQVHGEVNLKKHVQRLVAATKYREASKTTRSYSRRVINGGVFSGTYQRCGAHNDYPYYKNDRGAIIYADREAQMWCLSENGDFTKWRFRAPMITGVNEPPRRDWETSDEERGILPLEVFERGLKSLERAARCPKDHSLWRDARPAHVCDACRCRGPAYRCSAGCDYDLCLPCFKKAQKSCQAHTGAISQDVIENLIKIFGAKDSEGRQIVYRKRGDKTLAKEWSKIEDAPCSADVMWETCLATALRQLKEDSGFQDGWIVETTHPYDATRFQREVEIKDAPGLRVHFYSKCCTLDGSSRFQIFTGGLRRSAAGVGARVEVPAASGDKVWGTVVERSPVGEAGGDRWRVRLDRQEELRRSRSQTSKEDGASPTLPRGGVPKSWPGVGAHVEAKHKSGNWLKATILEVPEPTEEVSLVAAPRPAGAPWLASVPASADTAPAPALTHPVASAPAPASAVPKVFTCTVKPGAIGVELGPPETGNVTKLDAGGQAHALGVKVGMQLIKVGPADYSVDALRVAASGLVDYELTFKKQVRDESKYLIQWFDDCTDDCEKEREELRKLTKNTGEDRTLEELPRYARIAEAPSWSSSGEQTSGACYAVCMDEPLTKKVRYTKTSTPADEQGAQEGLVGDEIAEFGLDRTCPLRPINVKRFCGPGPAQEEGVATGWYLDLVSTMCGPSRPQMVEILQGIGGTHFDEESLDMHVVTDTAFQHISDLATRLNEGLRRRTDVTLFFTNSCAPSKVQLLPEVLARYSNEEMPGDEITGFFVREGQIYCRGFAKKGPAQTAGVRADWILDMNRTRQLNSNLIYETADVGIENGVTMRIDSGGLLPKAGLGLEVGKRVKITGCDNEVYSGRPGKIVDFDGDGDPIVNFDDGATDVFFMFDVTLCTEEEPKEDVGAKEEDKGAPTTDGDDKNAEMAIGRVDDGTAADKESKYEIHDLKIEYGEKDDYCPKFEKKIKELLGDLGVSDHSDLATVFPDYDPVDFIKVFAADGSEVASPESFGTLGALAFPVIFKIKLPKAAKKTIGGLSKESSRPPAEATLVDLLAGPRALLKNPGVTLAFALAQPDAVPRECYQASGPSTSELWKTCSISGEFAKFDFSTDGDSAAHPDLRWGVLALVLPSAIAVDHWVGQAAEAEAKSSKKIGYVGTPKLLGDVDIKARLIRLIEILVSKAHEVTVGGPNKELAEGTGALITDMASADADRFDVVLVAPGGPGAQAEAEKFAKHATILYFFNSKDVDFGKPDWLINLAGATELHDVAAMNNDEIASSVEVARTLSQRRSARENWCKGELAQRALKTLDEAAAIEAFLTRWSEISTAARGLPDCPEVERDGWDELRLRALCARHGWEFEWMSEDGERRRRAGERWSPMSLDEHAVLEAAAKASTCPKSFPSVKPGDQAEPDGATELPRNSENAELGATTHEPKVSGTWSLPQACTLGEKPSLASLRESCEIISTRDDHTAWSSVAKVVDALNAGTLVASKGLVVVYSASKGSYWLVWRSDKGDEAESITKAGGY